MLTATVPTEAAIDFERLKKAFDNFAHLRQAAEQGNAMGQYILGGCYRYGEGVEKDCVEAVKWYRKAAEQGDAYGQCSLGDCYYNGKGVDKDEAEAIRWYRKAADQGYWEAKLKLESLHEA